MNDHRPGDFRPERGRAEQQIAPLDDAHDLSQRERVGHEVALLVRAGEPVADRARERAAREDASWSPTKPKVAANFELAEPSDGGLSISRQRGDTTYALVSLAVFGFESLGLAVLTWAFLLRLVGVVPGGALAPIVIGCAASAGLALVVMAVFTMAQHARVQRSQARDQRDIEGWTERWGKILFADEPLPPPPLPAAAVTSALNLRELLKGEEGDRMVGALEGFGIEADLARQLGSARLATRLQALEALGKARLPGALEGLHTRFGAPQPVERLMATRAAARTLAVMPGGEVRDRAAAAFAEALGATELPAGVVLEVLLLLDDAAPGIIAHILGDPKRDPVTLRGATDAAGRLRLAALSDEISQGCRHAEPEVCASAFRALANIGLLPARAAAALPMALRSKADSVRVQAAHAAYLLPPQTAEAATWEGLGDASWWVRLASADSLLRVGEAGVAALERAATGHGDRYARDIAAQTLIDAREADLVLAA